jgi:hypothetical protein
LEDSRVLYGDVSFAVDEYLVIWRDLRNNIKVNQQ